MRIFISLHTVIHNSNALTAYLKVNSSTIVVLYIICSANISPRLFYSSVRHCDSPLHVIKRGATFLRTGDGQ